jgi:hypothetical protein
MTEPASHTLAYLRRLYEKFNRLYSEVGELRTEVGARLDRSMAGSTGSRTSCSCSTVSP